MKQREETPGEIEPSGVVNEYLTAFYTSDFDRASRLVDEGFTFRGPFVSADAKNAFFESAVGLKPIVRGHRLLRQWVNDGDVCSIFEMNLETPLGRGSVVTTEWHTVREGKIVAGRVILDSAEFRALVPTRPRSEV